MNPIQQQNKRIFLKTLKSELPKEALDFVSRWVDWEGPEELAVVETASHVNLLNIRSASVYGGDEEKIDSLINLKRLNDIRYINKFMEGVNMKLHHEGIFIGRVETSDLRRRRLIAKFFWPLNHIYFFFDYFVKRVWPKLPFFKRLYFFLTNGRNRVISEMETYGRLYSCGFRLLEAIEADGRLYFAAEKIKMPDFNMEASYGPLIRLQRVGQHGKILKVYKFRTMYPYSEYIQEFIYERYGLQKGGKFNNDPRVSKVGYYLRKYWLDEIPMLINLIKGELKVFGVRPLSRHYFNLYPEEFQEYRKRFKPGLIPPLYAEIPDTLVDIFEIEKRYLEAYERQPFLTDLRYTYRALYNIFIRRVRSK